MENQNQRKPRILCLHGFRTSGEIFRNQIGRWPETVLDKLDLVFMDAPFPAQGKAAPDIEAIYDPPYYEWFQANEDYTEFYNFDECVGNLEDYMLKHGPFDGLLGFSQGAMLSAAMVGMQKERVSLTKVPKIKFLVSVSGAKFGGPNLGCPELAAKAFSSPLNCPSLHFIGEMDTIKEAGFALLNAFVDPILIYHFEGHTVPKLDEKQVEIFLGFIEKVKNLLQKE